MPQSWNRARHRSCSPAVFFFVVVALSQCGPRGSKRGIEPHRPLQHADSFLILVTIMGESHAAQVEVVGFFVGGTSATLAGRYVCAECWNQCLPHPGSYLLAHNHQVVGWNAYGFLPED